jgi:hypothetical protein
MRLRIARTFSAPRDHRLNGFETPPGALPAVDQVTPRGHWPSHSLLR